MVIAFCVLRKMLSSLQIMHLFFFVFFQNFIVLILLFIIYIKLILVCGMSYGFGFYFNPHIDNPFALLLFVEKTFLSLLNSLQHLCRKLNDVLSVILSCSSDLFVSLYASTMIIYFQSFMVNFEMGSLYILYFSFSKIALNELLLIFSFSKMFLLLFHLHKLFRIHCPSTRRPGELITSRFAGMYSLIWQVGEGRLLKNTEFSNS